MFLTLVGMERMSRKVTVVLLVLAFCDQRGTRSDFTHSKQEAQLPLDVWTLAGKPLGRMLNSSRAHSKPSTTSLKTNSHPPELFLTAIDESGTSSVNFGGIWSNDQIVNARTTMTSLLIFYTKKVEGPGQIRSTSFWEAVRVPSLYCTSIHLNYPN